MSDEKKKKLDDIYKNLQKSLGKDQVFSGKDALTKVENVGRWKINSPNLSWVMGGGVPKGRLIEAYGLESGGKTSIAIFLAAEIQRQGGIVAYIDAENAADLEYAKSFGLNLDELIFRRPNSGEDALKTVQVLAENGVDFIIVDSVAALVPQAEIDGEMEDQQMGIQARLMGKGCRKISAVCAENNSTVFFINQTRESIGSYGNPLVTPGGKALKFWSSIRLDIRKAEFIIRGEETVGLKSKVKGVKNKTAPPMRQVEIEIIFGKGLQVEKEYIDFAVKFDIIKKAASWYSIFDEKGVELEKVQGMDKVVDYLKNNPETMQYIQDRVEKALNHGNVVEEPMEDGEE